MSLLLSLCVRSSVSWPCFPGSCLCIILVRGLGVRGEGQVYKSESVQADLVNGNGKVLGWPEVWIMSELEMFSFAGLHKQ